MIRLQISEIKIHPKLRQYGLEARYKYNKPEKKTNNSDDYGSTTARARTRCLYNSLLVVSGFLYDNELGVDYPHLRS